MYVEPVTFLPTQLSDINQYSSLALTYQWRQTLSGWIELKQHQQLEPLIWPRAILYCYVFIEWEELWVVLTDILTIWYTELYIHSLQFVLNFLPLNSETFSAMQLSRPVQIHVPAHQLKICPELLGHLKPIDSGALTEKQWKKDVSLYWLGRTLREYNWSVTTN